MHEENELPLAGLVVVDMSQFLSGPYCSLRLMDLGARVIKIERPDGGDLSRRLYLSDTEIGGDSTIFHAINRAKESLAIDLKDESDVAALKALLAKADVLIQTSDLASFNGWAWTTRPFGRSTRASSTLRSAVMERRVPGSSGLVRTCWRRRVPA